MAYSPAFQFYPSQFLSDKNTVRMSTETIGAYCLLIWFCWEEDGLPNDVDELADLARLSPEKFAPMWEKRIAHCFVLDEKKNRYFHPRLLKEIKKQKEWKRKKSEAGKKGMANRWKEKGNDDNTVITPLGSAITNDNSLSLSLSLPSIQEKDISNDISFTPKRSRKGLTPFPDDFTITPDMETWFSSHCPGLNIKTEFEAFRERCLAKGTEYKDWKAGWRTQMLNAVKWSTPQRSVTTTTTNGYDPRKDIMSPQYEMPPAARNDFFSAADYYFKRHCDGTREKYEQFKRNWLDTPQWSKGFEHEIDEYERGYSFRQRFGEAGQVSDSSSIDAGGSLAH